MCDFVLVLVYVATNFAIAIVSLLCVLLMIYIFCFHGFVQTVRGKCFEKCITKPGSSLSGSESSCISRCVERYIEATGIISRAMFSASR